MSEKPIPRTFESLGPMSGYARVPGDKSISHRALILSAMAVGESRIEGLLESEDVIATVAALWSMGSQIGQDSNGNWVVNGVGVGGLLQPETALDMGNSGTSARLLMGLVASHAITATFIGDPSLSKRPMGRVIEPLSKMGASFSVTPGDRLPLMVHGRVPAVPIEYRLPVASAQVKSAIMLAALNTPGITRVIEPERTRDHSERMLAGFGAEVGIEEVDGERVIAVTGEAELRPHNMSVPGDPSSAAFPLVAALLVPGSNVLIQHVGINPTRTGLFEILREMGADLTYENERDVGGEPVADIRARHSALTGIEVPPDIAPRMIDEFPILFVAAALADGQTVTRGLDELRHKESDRLAAMARGLAQLGVPVEERPDGLTITGSGGEKLKGDYATPHIATELDHRIAMSFTVAGLASAHGVTIDDIRPMATSFPSFPPMLEDLGAIGR
ncbi:3-phosphoshikimate 1-carboxyvinyltransferase [Parasphingopyxis algicola]|uniref:3-phosphoshikimate 1-carboxyvinyltransferase n=1 Tax=Parasphingopyxis algicola TaxID=2026624 RepID=UPI0015A27DBD|nr:3-phosphoshikimate 1-carboxyvinyltransferase [Parasphingopyxis algicola]QLC24666.1 3-phosphoshikimate 1-carboxyvinyltransferase [Parasphingopyxis algicola]